MDWSELLSALVGGGLVLFGAFITQHYAAKREAAAALEARNERRRHADATVLQDLQTALVAWFESMIAVANPSSAVSDRFPELRVLMLVESVRDEGLRDGVYQLMEKAANTLFTIDPSLSAEQRRDLLRSVMSQYPAVQRALGEQLRQLN